MATTWFTPTQGAAEAPLTSNPSMANTEKPLSFPLLSVRRSCWPYEFSTGTTANLAPRYPTTTAPPCSCAPPAIETPTLSTAPATTGVWIDEQPAQPRHTSWQAISAFHPDICFPYLCFCVLYLVSLARHGWRRKGLRDRRRRFHPRVGGWANGEDLLDRNAGS